MEVKDNFKNVIRFFVPPFIRSFLLREYHSFKFRTTAKENEKHYAEVVKVLREKVQANESLNVAMLVMYDSVFACDKIFKLMQEEQMFNPKIIIVADVLRGQEHLQKQYSETKEFFITKYGAENVLDGWDLATEQPFDLLADFDLVYCAEPYDPMEADCYQLENLRKRHLLPFYLGYGFCSNKFTGKNIYPRTEISNFWRFYADTPEIVKELKKHQLIKGKNVVLSGYAKIDSLAEQKIIARKRKKIIIAPHHTVAKTWDNVFALSNFLKYADFFLELPQKYPSLDFVFRPHPLLFVSLVNEKLWTEKQVEDYLKKMEDLGIEYSHGGNYLELFANSDGIIHDCASFVAEYLFTNKPGCYLLKSKKQMKQIFSPLGLNCLKQYYLAFEKEEIFSFLDQVILEENDFKAVERKKYLEQNLYINYPQTSEFIVQNIKNTFLL